MPSFYIPELSEFHSGMIVELSGAEHHHLSRVSRHQSGDAIKLNNGSGLLALGRITEIGKNSTMIEVMAQIPVQAVPDYAIAFALLKSQNDELLVEKCTELGASAFFPFVSEFTIRKPSPNTAERFAKIALAAIKQCDNPYLPGLEPCLKLSSALELIRSKGFEPVVCSESRPGHWVDQPEIAKPCFLIGPEGGWSPAELELFQAQKIPEISISPLICRAETAAITVAAQWVFFQK